MIVRHCKLALVGIAAAALGMAGCAGFRPPPPPPPPAPPPAAVVAAPAAIPASPEPKVSAPITIMAMASPDTNPDPAGRPSPVVVRVYQLKGDGAFSRSEFFALFDDEQKVLGSELISRDEYVLAPAERRTIGVTVSGDARFVGAIAAFRDIRNSQWRVVGPVPRRSITVVVERAKVMLFVLD